jgi:CTP synthase (UTP-ammonia lyase)
MSMVNVMLPKMVAETDLDLGPYRALSQCKHLTGKQRYGVFTRVLLIKSVQWYKEKTIGPFPHITDR